MHKEGLMFNLQIFEEEIELEDYPNDSIAGFL